jgi:hypothetical protein
MIHPHEQLALALALLAIGFCALGIRQAISQIIHYKRIQRRLAEIKSIKPITPLNKRTMRGK